VARTVSAPNGAAAALMLEDMKKTSHRTGFSSADLVVTDVAMPRLSGLGLLRWLRQSRESPNRFTPVLMLSVAAQRRQVELARDMGANEFVSVPFTGRTVAAHLLSIIDRPRDFVHCDTYFGPCRRRKPIDAPVPDRRVTSEEDVKVLYLEKNPDETPHKQPVMKFKLPNTLRSRVGGVPGRPGVIDPKLVRAADREITAKLEDYSVYFERIVADLNEAMKRALTDPDELDRAYRRISELAVELRSQGVVFGYPLISTVSSSMFGYVYEPKQVDADHMALVKAHVDIINNVVSERVSGDGGDLGASLLTELKRAKTVFEERRRAAERAMADPKARARAIVQGQAPAAQPR